MFSLLLWTSRCESVVFSSSTSNSASAPSSFIPVPVPSKTHVIPFLFFHEMSYSLPQMSRFWSVEFDSSIVLSWVIPLSPILVSVTSTRIKFRSMFVFNLWLHAKSSSTSVVFLINPWLKLLAPSKPIEPSVCSMGVHNYCSWFALFFPYFYNKVSSVICSLEASLPVPQLLPLRIYYLWTFMSYISFSSFDSSFFH